MVSVASVSEAPHVLVLVTWVTWVYFPILFSLFSPGEEEGLVTTCRKSGTLGISAQHVSVSPFCADPDHLSVLTLEKALGPVAWDRGTSTSLFIV